MNLAIFQSRQMQPGRFGRGKREMTPRASKSKDHGYTSTEPRSDYKWQPQSLRMGNYLRYLLPGSTRDNVESVRAPDGETGESVPERRILEGNVATIFQPALGSDEVRQQEANSEGAPSAYGGGSPSYVILNGAKAESQADEAADDLGDLYGPSPSSMPIPEQ